MAKIEDILQLKEAGFTAEEITSLLGVITHEEPKAEEPKPVEIKDNRGDKLYDRIGELITKIEANAIGSTSIPKSENNSAEDILAKIVSPK